MSDPLYRAECRRALVEESRHIAPICVSGRNSRSQSADGRHLSLLAHVEEQGALAHGN